MLGAAFAAAAVSAVTGSAWAGLAAGVLTSVALALLIGFACITHRGNQVVAAMAVNIMVAGLGPSLALAWFDLGGQTPQLDAPGQRFLGIVWPWAERARETPVPGPALRGVAQRPQPRRLSRGGARAGRRLGALPDALRPAAARGGREPGGGRHRRHLGERPALPGGADLGRALRRGRRLPLDGGQRGLRARHDRGQGLPGAGGADLRQVAALAHARRLPAVRVHRRAGRPPAGRGRCRWSA